MTAEDHFQNLKHGINLLNLLMFYPAPSNEAVVSAIDQLLDEAQLQLAVDDLRKLEEHLISLPESAGPEMKACEFSELAGGPLQDLLRRLSRLNALYAGKAGAGATLQVREQLQAERFANLHDLQLALANVHQLKAGV